MRSAAPARRSGRSRRRGRAPACSHARARRGSRSSSRRSGGRARSAPARGTRARRPSTPVSGTARRTRRRCRRRARVTARDADEPARLELGADAPHELAEAQPLVATARGRRRCRCSGSRAARRGRGARPRDAARSARPSPARRGSARAGRAPRRSRTIDAAVEVVGVVRDPRRLVGAAEAEVVGRDDARDAPRAPGSSCGRGTTTSARRGAENRVALALVEVVHPQPVLVEVVGLEREVRESLEALVGRAVRPPWGLSLRRAGTGPGETPDQSAARTVPGDACTAGDGGHPRASASSASSRSIASEQLPVRERVGVEADPETGLVDALGVVVLVPEQRQRDHRLAEVEALGRRVVAAVGDDEVDQRQDRRLGHELLAPHVVGELVLRRLRPLATR